MPGYCPGDSPAFSVGVGVGVGVAVPSNAGTLLVFSYLHILSLNER